MKKRVLLFFPNTSNEGVMTLAVAILSAIAKDLDWEVAYFETSFYNKHPSATEERESTGEFKPVDRGKEQLLPYESMQKDFQQLVSQFQPHVLAVHANSLEFELFEELMDATALDEPKPFVLLGGVHATVAPEKAIASKHVDAICEGEGENAWREFLSCFSSGKEISGIQSLWVKTEAGVIKNPLASLAPAEKLWDIPLDYSFFDERHLTKPFDGKMYRRGLVELSRGCPYSCNYCVNSALKARFKGLGRFFRVRPLDNLKEGIERLLGMGAEMLQFQDECFFSIKTNRLQEFCQWYQDEVRLPLLLQTRPESITREKMEMVAKMGVPVQVSCGVESGSPRILKDICNRHMSLGQIKAAYAIIKEFGLRSNAYAMIGFPTETREDVFRTIELIREIQPDVSVMSVFYPFEGVPLRKMCVDEGFISGNEPAKTFTSDSILLRQPMTPLEISGLRRCYRLYTKLPKSYFSKIELCEKDLENHRELFQELVDLSWNSEAL